MSDLIFFTKSLVFTFIIIILMQIKIGPNTLEDRAMHWVKSSEIVEPIKEVAKGGVIFIRQMWRNATGNINAKFLDTFDNDQSPGRRSLNFSLERSEKFVKEQADRAKEIAEEQSQKARGRFRSFLKKEVDTQFDEFKEEAHNTVDESTGQ